MRVASSLKSIKSFNVINTKDTNTLDNKSNLIPEKLNHSMTLSFCLSILLVCGLGIHIIENGLDNIGLNQIIMFMIALGLLLHKSPLRYMNAVRAGASGCSGIMIQFPLYAGIMSMMTTSGIMDQITELFINNSTKETMPIFTMISAGIVNLFVPSGGGQWAMQAPIALQSGLEFGIAPGKMVMAVAYGDQLTNMLQPFWALPLLAISGVRAKDIVGYTTIIMIAALIWITFGLLIF